jgi:hypothetical protein
MILCGALAVALTSCTTYVEERRPRAAYVSPPPAEVTPAPPAIVVAPAEAPVVVLAPGQGDSPNNPRVAFTGGRDS